MPLKRVFQADKENSPRKQAKQPDTPGLDPPGKQIGLAATLQQARVDPRSLNPQGVLQLQRLVGNQAVQSYLQNNPEAAGPAGIEKAKAASPRSSSNLVQRLILHDDYQAETSESMTLIKDELETQETVETLQKNTGQETDLYKGNKLLDHSPKENYLISHGFLGGVVSYSYQSLAGNLIDRGIKTGDILRLITCQIGQPGGDADKLADELGAKNIKDVIIYAPTGYIHWNADGPVVVSNYPRDNTDLSKAQKIWTNTEDKGWKGYVKSLKESISKPLDKLLQNQNGEKGLQEKLRPIIEAEPEKFKEEHLVWLNKAAQEKMVVDKLKIYKNIINQLQQAEVVNKKDSSFRQKRSEAQDKFRERLKQVLETIHNLLASNSESGQKKYDKHSTRARTLLREALKNKWQTYSKKYYGILRQKYNDPKLWRELKSGQKNSNIQSNGANLDEVLDEIINGSSGEQNTSGTENTDIQSNGLEELLDEIINGSSGEQNTSGTENTDIQPNEANLNELLNELDLQDDN